MTAPIVVVGASLAGVRVAQGLRLEGCEERIVLVDEQDELPYDKPPLSKEVLLSGHFDPRLRLLSEHEATRLGVDLQLGVGASHLDAGQKLVTLRDGSVQLYSRLVVATGAHARPSPWGQADGVFTLRTLTDALRLSRFLQDARTLTIVGAGLIGTEVASAATTRGVHVTLVDPASGPLSRIVSRDVSRWLADWYEGHGVALRFDAAVEGIDQRPGRHLVRLVSGETVESDCVVVAIGSQPSVAWLADSGLAVDDGVLCSEAGDASGITDVYAVGDVARWWDPEAGAFVRHEHWTRAVEHAACVAHNIAHPKARRTAGGPPYAWSDQFGSKLQVVGRCLDRTTQFLPGSGPEQWAALYATEDRLVGAAVLNWPKALVSARRSLETTSDLTALRRHLEGGRTMSPSHSRLPPVVRDLE